MIGSLILSALTVTWGFNEPKGTLIDPKLPMAALLGNGDVGLVNGDVENGKGFQITKTGFFSCGKLTHSFAVEDRDGIQQVAFGKMIYDFGRPVKFEDTLLTETGDLISKSSDGSIHLRTWIPTGVPVIVTEVLKGKLPKVRFEFKDDPDFPHGENWRKTYNGVPDDKNSWQLTCTADTQVKEGKYLVTTVLLDTEKPPKALSVKTLRKVHEKYWHKWWGRSSVTLNDEVLQRYYDGSLYLLGAGVNKNQPCGLYAGWVTTDVPLWRNDLHLNYNMISPFYGVYTANRCEIAQCLVEPMLKAIPLGEENALKKLTSLKQDYVETRPELKNGIANAILLPVGMLPNGMTTHGDTCFLAQIMNAPFTASTFCTYYEYTLDDAYLTRVYPFIEKTANFLVAWCEKEKFPNGKYRYNLYDSYGENEGWGRNCSPTLGCAKHIFAVLSSVEKDAKKRAVWTDYRDHLADFPLRVYEVKDFKRKILSLCETDDCGYMVRGSGAVELEAVIPGEAIGFDSPKELLECARNTVDAMFAKCGVGEVAGNINQTPKLFATAARVGYPAKDLIELFKKHQLNELWRKNLTINDGYHGIEKSGGIEFINSMLLQSDNGKVKVFPNWTGKDASFRDLRAKGAFLVSAEMRGGKTANVKVKSLKGGPLEIIINGKTTKLNTIAGKEYRL